MVVSRRVIVVGGTTGFGLVVAVSYWYLSDRINQSSSLVQQTVLNVSLQSDLRDATGGSCTAVSRIFGEMLQRKGTANILLDVECNKGRFTVEASARRQGVNWQMNQITLYRNGREMLLKHDFY